MNKFLRNKTIWVPSVALVSILSLSLFLCSGDNHVTLDEFLGVWKTSALTYEDRFFGISDSTITFGTGNGNQDICYIQAATETIEDKNILYTITCANFEKTEFKLSFYYKKDNGGVIQFKNQMDIEWTRDN